MYKTGVPIKHIIGTSKEVKPKLDPGDRFYEEDTGNEFVCKQDGTWKQLRGVRRITESVTFASGIATANFSFFHSGYVNLVACSAASMFTSTTINIVAADEDGVELWSKDVPQATDVLDRMTSDKYFPVSGEVFFTASLSTPVAATIDGTKIVIYLDD